MALENTLNNIGDFITFKSNIINGADSINGFLDSVIGELGDRFFIKQFRYTTDMVNWTDEWITLSNANLQAVVLSYRYDWQIEYKYTRGGTNATGTIAFEWISLQLAMNGAATCGNEFDESIYKYFFETCNEQSILAWCANVLQKLYYPGIVSKSLIRGENRNASGEDRDYVDFWRTTTCFFGTQVAYARQFENFDLDERLFRRYLTTKGMFVDKNQTIPVMAFLMTNFVKELVERGTIRIAQSHVENIGGNDEDIHGELLRLVNYSSICDEMIFLINNPNTVGWIIDVNSPLNKYIHSNPWAVKLYNDSHVPANIPLINPTKVALVTFDGYDNVFHITNVLAGTTAGIGLTSFDADFATKVDRTIPYELTFWAQGDAVFSATIKGFDINNVSSDPEAVGPLQTGNGTVAITQCELAQADQWYFVRIILFPFDESIVDDPAITRTSILYGWNQRALKDICSASVEILVDRGASGTPITVINKTITIRHGQLYTLKRRDLLIGWMRNRERFEIVINITAFSGPGDLLLDSTPVTVFPQIVTTEELFDGKLQFQDDGTDPLAKTITITYNVLEVTGAGTDSDFLYIRDIEFKPLRTTYGKGLVGSPLLVETWLKNRSELSQDSVNEAVRRYLIPHEVGILNNFIDIGDKRIDDEEPPQGLYEERYEEIYE